MAIFLFLFSASILLTFANLDEPSREAFQHFFLKNKRVVLAKAVGDLTGRNEQFTVLKVKTRDTLSIEVYQNTDPENASTTFLSRHVFPEKRESQFTFQGNAVSLILMDVNADGSLEIVTSTYDENLVAKVYVLHFNSDHMDFELLDSESLPL